MKRSRTDARWCAGASLLEVLVAISLLAVSLLGIAAAQIAALGDAHDASHRAQSSWLAASIVEAARWSDHSSFLLDRSRMYADAALPGGRIEIVDEAAGVRAVAVRWRAARDAGLRPPTIDQDPCRLAQHPAFGPCVSLPFVTAQ